MVQIKTTTVALVAAALVAPAVASSYYYAEDGLVAREDYNEYNDVLARDYDYDLEEREYVDDLFEREFTDSELVERELDDLFERSPFLGFHHLKKWWGNRKAKKQAKKEAQLASQQEGGSSDGYSGSPVDTTARGFDDEMEIEAREPEADYEELLQRYFDDLYERELTAEAEAEIAARELESEEFDIFQRSPEPNIVDWFKNLFHPKKKQDQKKKADASSDSKKAESSSSDSKTAASPADSPADAAVDAREYYEDFDELD
jgi:hypothetical protein